MTSIVEGVRNLAARLRPRWIEPCSTPQTMIDDRGRTVGLRPYWKTDFDALVRMYDDFDPAQRAQGVPPLAAEGIRSWVSEILEGPNVVALCDDRIVGHVSFVPDGTGRYELSIFVHQSFQRAGIGSYLLACGLGHAREAGVEYAWLSVEKDKRHQQRFYSRAGFSVTNPLGMTHRMSRRL